MQTVLVGSTQPHPCADYSIQYVTDLPTVMPQLFDSSVLLAAPRSSPALPSLQEQLVQDALSAVAVGGGGGGGGGGCECECGEKCAGRDA